MTSKTSDVKLHDLMELHRSAKEQLVHAIKALGSLEHRIEKGEIGPKSEITKVLADIRDWLKIAHEMEVRLDRNSQDYSDGEERDALNLDEARSEIGRRLSRLRGAGGAADLSG